MIFFDGTYRLKKDDQTGLRAGSDAVAYSWRIRIINLSLGNQEVLHLRPFIVVVTHTGDGLFQSNCAEHLGRSICRDFDLDIENILWIEQFPGKTDTMQVAVFQPKSYFVNSTFYDINWRPIRNSELELIRPFISETG